MSELTFSLKIYVISIIALGLAFLIFLTFKMNVPKWEFIFFWVIILILAELTPVNIPQIGAALSISSAIVLASILLFGPGIAAWFGVLSAIICDGIIRKVPFYKSAFNGAQVIISFGGAGVIYYVAGGLRFLPELPENYEFYQQILLPLFLLIRRSPKAFEKHQQQGRHIDFASQCSRS